MHLVERGGGLWPSLVRLFILLFAPAVLAQVGSAPPRVQVVLVSVGGDDVHLDQRVRTLFDPTTAVELRVQPSLSSVEVLEPARSDTVYVFVTLSVEGRALVYVATREANERAARYLLREVALESGLDEIGAETVAQVTHSSVMALWSRAAETSQDAVAGELAREQERSAPSPKAPHEGPPPAATARPAPPPTTPSDGAAPLAPRFGATLAAHASGDEGFLVSAGLFAGFMALERFGLRLDGSYVLPSRFEVGPALVQVSGFGGEARASALFFRSRDLRLRLDAGGGVLWVRWEAQETLSAEGSTWSLESERETRGYVLAGLAAELPLGSLLDAALRAELRVLTTPVRYGVVAGGQRETQAEVHVAPGLALELWLPQDAR